MRFRLTFSGRRQVRGHLIIVTICLVGLIAAPRVTLAVRSSENVSIHFEHGQSARAIPIEVVGEGLVFVKGKVREAEVWLLLDTASPSVLSQRLAELLGLAGEEKDSAGGGAVGNPTAVRTLRNVSVRLPGLELTQPQVSSFDLDHFQMSLGHRLDGILGGPLFECSVVEVDYARAQMAVYARQTRPAPPKAIAIPIRREDGLPFVDATIALGGRPPLSGSFLIDSGVDNAAILFSPFVDSHALLSSSAKAPEESRGGSAASFEAVIRAERLELSSFVLREPIVQLARSTKGRLADRSHAGLIGAAILSRFRATFDLPRDRIWLEKNARYSDPFLHDASGLTLAAQGIELSTFEIQRVSPASPADAAGLTVGDVILAVDGKPAKLIGLRGIRRLFQQEGKSYVLTVLREGVARRITLECRRRL